MLLLIFINLLGCVFAAYKNQALEQCISSDAFGVSTDEIPDINIIASSWTNKREGFHGRLFHNSAWQAASNNYNQYLQVDLGDRKLITSVATQGYRGSQQFVIDYYITYSNDNTTFTPIVNNLGEPNVFPGNENDDAPQFNTLEYPVVARYVRFVPRRWSVNIALRVELYGCGYEGEAVSFDGTGAIWFDAHEPNTLFTTTDMMRIRMKTSEPEGVLFYAAGNQGDHICIELVEGLLYVDISLGLLSWSTSGARGVAGSLLDDNQWHDVELVRVYKNLTISVDRVPINVTIDGEYQRMDLDRYLYVGGVPTFYQPGITARSNFSGCMENVVWNGIHMTRDLQLPRFGTTGGVFVGCEDGRGYTPYTLAAVDSSIRYTVAAMTANNLQFRLEFRTYDKNRLLLMNNIVGGIFLFKIDENGFLKYELKASATAYSVIEYANSDENGGDYTDGLWHSVIFSAKQNFVNLTVDGKEFITKRQLSFSPGTTFTIGSGNPDYIGFVGCLRGIFLTTDASATELVCKPDICTSVQNGTCGLKDRCHPNPCEHRGNCMQTFTSFTCNCTDNGYKGATCHQPAYPNSCSRVLELNTKEDGVITTKIDIDGAGSLPPFEVQCSFAADKMQIETTLHHNGEAKTLVDGYQRPGSYIRNIVYTANVTQIDQLVARADTCRQFIEYRCQNSLLLARPGITETGDVSGSKDGTAPELGQVYEAYGWWVGRNYQFNYYWGGSAPGTHKCLCGLVGNCQGNKASCNCDAGLDQEDISDSGMLNYKDHLPVLQLRFGDTGALNDRKLGWHTLGPLICAGDKLFDLPVTFRRTDAIVFFDTFWTRQTWELTTWDVSFRFKTTAESGVMVSRVGPKDFVEVKLVTSTSVSFRFSAGYGVQAVVKDTSFMLNDDQWHTVYVERNRKEAVLQIDEFQPAVVQHPDGIGYLTFEFTSPLVVGASVDYQDGYVGCMSSLQVNGETLDLYDKVANTDIFKYGMSLGCVGKCAINPCMNGGLCKEKYSGFLCDCSYTPWRGLICGRETGTSFYSGQMLIYQPPGNVKTNSENITVGFFTRKKAGVIMQIADDIENPTEYIAIEMTNGGGIRVLFKFDAKRLQVWTKVENIDFANGQPHVIRFRRSQFGRRMILQVDDYEPITEEDLTALFPQDSDVFLNVKYILIGRNSTSDKLNMFEGCIFRAEFDNHWPIKRAFQEPRPDYVSAAPSFDAVREERCGFEEILPPEEPFEMRPTYLPPVQESAVDRPTQQVTESQNAAYLGVIFGVVGIILIAIVSIVVYKCRHVGKYPEEDAEEREMLDTSGHEDYNPRGRSEKYEMKVAPNEQAFI